MPMVLGSERVVQMLRYLGASKLEHVSRNTLLGQSWQAEVHKKEYLYLLINVVALQSYECRGDNMM